MKPQPNGKSSRARARWGIFVTTIVMGAALLATGLSSLSEQREAADAVAEARAYDLFHAVRRTLRDEGIESFDLSGLLTDFEEAGLRYVALVGFHGQLLASAGTALGAGAPDSEHRPPAEPVVRHVGERVRLDAQPYAPPGGRG